MPIQVLHNYSVKQSFISKIYYETARKSQEEQREREQINESGGGHRTPDPGPQKQK